MGEKKNMNMNKKFLKIFILLFVLLVSVPVFAEEKCNYWASSSQCHAGVDCQALCESKSYNGYKCEWNKSGKAGNRCKQSKKLTDEEKESITSCDQIKDQEICNASQVKGHECIYRQHKCVDNTLIDDGTDETIIADDQDERDEIEKEKKPDAGVPHKDLPNTTLKHDYVGINACSETSVQRVLHLVGIIISIAKLLVPFIIIFMGSVDLFKAVTGGDQKVLFKSLKSLGLRLVLGIFIFFIPTIVKWFFDIYYESTGGSNNQQCINCVLDVSSCANVASKNNASNSNNSYANVNATDNDKKPISNVSNKETSNVDYSIYIEG